MADKRIPESEESRLESNAPEEPEVLEIVEETAIIEKPIPEVLSGWHPLTEVGRKVKERKITDIDQIIDEGKPIKEAEIVDALLPNLEADLLLIGQGKGKFGGGQRRAFSQTQKKTKEGNKLHFKTCSVVGNRDGYVGVDFGKSKETVPAKEKSLRNAKLALIRIRRGCGSWQCNCRQPHSLPFEVSGKHGSCEITLLPAPKGKGLVVEKECRKVLGLAGVKDIWSKSKGKTVTKENMILALMDALSNLNKMKIRPQDIPAVGMITGRNKSAESFEAAPLGQGEE